MLLHRACPHFKHQGPRDFKVSFVPLALCPRIKSIQVSLRHTLPVDWNGVGDVFAFHVAVSQTVLNLTRVPKRYEIRSWGICLDCLSSDIVCVREEGECPSYGQRVAPSNRYRATSQSRRDPCSRAFGTHSTRGCRRDADCWFRCASPCWWSSPPSWIWSGGSRSF